MTGRLISTYSRSGRTMRPRSHAVCTASSADSDVDASDSDVDASESSHPGGSVLRLRLPLPPLCVEEPMLTLCWAAKGGTGTTVVSASLALTSATPTLLVDLDGDLPLVLGLGDLPGPGVREWLRSTADAGRLASLEVRVDQDTQLLPAGATGASDEPSRWHDLAAALAADRRDVVVDAGSGSPPPALAAAAERRWLVTRPCYLALRAAAKLPCAPTGIVLVDEPGRALGAGDIESSLGAPVVTQLLVDPAVARAVDSGLLLARVPRAFTRRIRAVA